MIIEKHIDIDVSPAVVMSCYQDVSAWPEWDPDTRAATIDGPFQPGMTGRLHPTRGFSVPMRFVDVTVSGFTVESPAPFCTMRFEHELVPVAGGTRVTHRVSFEGPLAKFFGWLVGARVQTGLPVTLAMLKRRLESQDGGRSL